MHIFFLGRKKHTFCPSCILTLLYLNPLQHVIINFPLYFISLSIFFFKGKKKLPNIRFTDTILNESITVLLLQTILHYSINETSSHIFSFSLMRRFFFFSIDREIKWKVSCTSQAVNDASEKRTYGRQEIASLVSHIQSFAKWGLKYHKFKSLGMYFTNFSFILILSVYFFFFSNCGGDDIIKWKCPHIFLFHWAPPPVEKTSTACEWARIAYSFVRDSEPMPIYQSFTGTILVGQHNVNVCFLFPSLFLSFSLI